MPPKILESKLFSPGTKFIAMPDIKDNVLPPHTIGFISFFQESDRDYQNVAYVTVSVIRRGKSGQQRIEQREISFPIFYDKAMLKQEGYLPSNRRCYLHIEREPMKGKNLIETQHLEFLGWAFAYTKYLKYIVKNFIYPGKRAIWEEKSVGKDLLNIEGLPQFFADRPTEAASVFAAKDFRFRFINTIRALECKLFKCVCSYRRSALGTILNSSNFIDYTNENYYKVADEKLTKNTVSFYKKRYKEIEKHVEKINAVPKRKEGFI